MLMIDFCKASALYIIFCRPEWLAAVSVTRSQRVFDQTVCGFGVDGKKLISLSGKWFVSGAKWGSIFRRRRGAGLLPPVSRGTTVCPQEWINITITIVCQREV